MNANIWALIKRLYEIDKLSISEIARQTKVDRKTVRSVLSQQSIPVRKQYNYRPSKLDPYKDYITERLERYPRLNGNVLFEELKKLGYLGKLRILLGYLAQTRRTKKEAFLRIETLPAEYAQVDWANCGTVQIGNALRKLSCFIMVLSFSRLIYLEFTLSQCLEDFIACHINAFKFFGGITNKILYDNLKTVVLSRLGKDIQFNPKFMEFAGMYLFEPVVCNIARGNEKGKVENGVKYVRGNFLAGRTVSWPKIQADACKWRDEIANIRTHGTTRQRPIDRFEQEKHLLQPLPAHEYDTTIKKTITASSQAFVNFDGNAYSVPYVFAYKPVFLKSSKDEVLIFNPDKLNHIIASHRRSFERGIAIEDPKHYEGLIAEKKKAFASKLKDQFLNLGELAKNYLDGLIVSELNVHHHIAQIMQAVRLYGKTEILQAIDHALRHKAYGAPYLKNIILQQRAARGLKEHIPIIIPAKPAWTELAVEEQDLSLYDDLFDDTDNNQTIKDENK